MSELVRNAVRALASGKIVCFPTETTYGLAVDIRDRDALARLSTIKQREPTSPFALIVPSIDAAQALALVWPEAAAKLASEHWPGPLTLIVPARPDLPAEIIGPSGGVGVRMSSHPMAGALARELGGAITATSANPSGHPPALSVDEALAYFGGDVDVYVDGGRCAAASASTVVVIDSAGGVTVLRPGALALGPRG